MIKTEKSRKVRSSGKLSNAPPAFLVKTYEILENYDYSDIISWNSEGDAFIVKRQNDFAEKILPKYFKHNNFQSFIRQLNMYDFHKFRQENHENIFKHHLFRRGQKELLKNIKRKATDLYNTQIAPLNNTQELDIERYNKDYKVFTQELINLKRKQEEYQQITSLLIQQNHEILNENKLLWKELMKTREKKEKKFDKFFQILIQCLNNNPALTYPQLNQVEEKSKQTKEEQKIFDNTQKDSHTPVLFNNSYENPTYNKNEMALFSKESDLKTEESDKSSIQYYNNSIAPPEKKKDEYKIISYLDNFHDGQLNLLQNLAKIINSPNDKPLKQIPEFNIKRNRNDYNLNNSLKYLEDNYFNKRKKIKKSKGKKDHNLMFPSENSNYNYNSLFQNLNSNIFTKQNDLNSSQIKIEGNQNSFNPFFLNSNNMLTNYPNNELNKFQPNYFNSPNNEIFKIDDQNNLLKSPLLEKQISFSRKNSFHGDMNIEDFNNYENNNNLNMSSYFTNFPRNMENKEEDIDKISNISLNLEKF